MATTVDPTELARRSARRCSPASASTSTTASRCSRADDLLGARRRSPTTARRLRGGTDDVYFVNNLYLNHTNDLPREVQVLRLRPHVEAGGRATSGTSTSSSPTRRRSARRPGLHRDPHGRRRASAPRLLVLRRHHARACTGALPDVHLKFFTASEIHHMTKLSGLTHEEVLRELVAAGLGTLPGGGAEVFADRACARSSRPARSRPSTGCTCTAMAHRMGMPTHCTMLYNHVETYEERVDHLLAAARPAGRDRRLHGLHPAALPPAEHRLRAARLDVHDRARTTSRCIAVSRLMLDNIEHVKAYWIMISTPLAQVALHFGANDIQGTVVEEKIAHAAGAVTPTEEKVASLVRPDPRGRAHARAARHALQRRCGGSTAVDARSASAASASSTRSRSSGRSARHLRPE